MLRLILKENSFHFNGNNYLQTHGTAMGTKMAVSFANIFMATVEREIISRSVTKPLTWKRYIADVFSLWNVSKNEIKAFIELANNYHATIKFTAEIQILKSLSLTHVFTRARDLKMNLFLTCARTSNRRKLSSTRISPPATHQASGKASSKAKP